MNLSRGLIVVVQTSWKSTSLPSRRSFSTIFTGALGAGKRSDSENVRLSDLASSVSAHSLKSVPKPREYSSLQLAWSRTSKTTGGAYLFLKLTDPSQPDPVLCNLYKNASGPAVLWTR